MMSETNRRTGPAGAHGAPPHSKEEEAFLSLVRTSARLEHSAAEWLKPYDLTPTQYNALRILRGAGPGGLCRNEVGARMINPVPDVTRLLDRLVDAGYVVRERDERDRRYVTARITEEGLALLARLDEPIVRLHEAQLGHLSPADLDRLIELADRVRGSG